MKKIGIIVNSIGYGGNERSAVNIAQAINEDYDVSIIIQEDNGNHYQYDGEVVSLNTPCASSKIGKAINAIRRVIRLRRVIVQKRIDTLFIILPVTNPINYLPFKCKKIVSCRDCGDLIRRTKKYIKMTECADLMICNSNYQASYLSNAMPTLRSKIKTIPNIVDIDKVSQLKDQAIDPRTMSFIEDKHCIISVGRFAAAKGFDNLIKSFSILSKNDNDARLIIIGDGELRGNIERLISNLNLKDKVLLTGFQDNPFKYISKADVFVLSSLYEGFPNVLVEAMACSTPVIATDCPSGPAEILDTSIKDQYSIGKGGILIQGFDESLSNWEPNDINNNHINLSTVIQMILNDTVLQKQMVSQALNRIEDYSYKSVIESWKTVL